MRPSACMNPGTAVLHWEGNNTVVKLMKDRTQKCLYYCLFSIILECNGNRVLNTLIIFLIE